MLIRPVIPSHEFADLYLPAIDEHPVELFDGARGRLVGFVMDVAITLRHTRDLVGNDLTAQYIPEQAEGIVQLLIVDPVVQILDEYIAYAGPTYRRIALTPHDTTRLALNIGIVHTVQCAIGIGRLMIVHVRVSERPARHGVPTHSYARYRAHGVEDFEQQALVDLGEQVADVQARREEVGTAFAASAAHVVVHAPSSSHGHGCHCPDRNAAAAAADSSDGRWSKNDGRLLLGSSSGGGNDGGFDGSGHGWIELSIF